MEHINKFVDKYKLKIGGTEFWVPYPYEKLTLQHRREFSGKKPAPLPFKGRGTPEQIKEYLIDALEKEKTKPKTPEEYRAFMSSINLGVECSGFAYYVLDEYLKENYNEELRNHLYKSKEQLLEIYGHPNLSPPKGLKRSVVETYPNWVSLARIQKDWGNNPRYVIDAPVFSNEGSTIPVKIADIQPADIISMVGHDNIGHPLLVVSVNNNVIVYAHSAGRHGRKSHYGGVEYGEIKIIDTELPIEKQEWQDKLLLKAHKFKPGAIRRLKTLEK
ncbi:MAG: hypothetical protein WDZ40_01535 [Candidatus Spechtbacterales bacterium]